MNRIVSALVALGALLALIVILIDVRSDAAAVFGPGGPELDGLDTAQGREVVVALVSEDIDRRTDAARALETLDDPLIETIRIGPGTPSEGLLNWLWLNRLRLTSPTANDLSVEAMTATLTAARKALASGEGMMLGDRLLRDPTGSFERLLKALLLANGERGLAQHKGVFQSADNTAALVFITLTDTPFDTAATTELAHRIRAGSTEGNNTNLTPDIEILLLGPRVVAAEISAETERASMRAAFFATLLLLLWLLWALRWRMPLALIPLALGIAVACLAVQLIFGSVHVVALGFGGALTGLALDYPLHLFGHSGRSRPHANRLVLVGAVTTAVGFLAMLGSGVPALMQTGVFIATGLAVAALASRLVLAGIEAPLRAPPLERLAVSTNGAGWISAALCVAAALVIASSPAATPTSIFEPPARVKQTVARFGEMITLPSGRHALDVEAPDLETLIEREIALRPILDKAVEEGHLAAYRMLAQFVAPSQPLPSVEDFAVRAKAALTKAGMAPTYAATQAEAYGKARTVPPIPFADLMAFPETRALLAGIEWTDAGLRERIRLTGSNPVSLEISTEGARLVDIAEPIESGVLALRRDVVFWLAAGAAASFLILLLALRNLRAAARIALTAAAGVGVTAAILTLTLGPLSVFQIVALTLVTGIGIDYGLFLGTAADASARREAFRSVALCAGSTLIAFAVMALAPVSILSEIGLTVSLGVMAMLGLSLIQPPVDDR